LKEFLGDLGVSAVDLDFREYTGDPMKSIIVGTAGHIDHGKTALVKALTGIDADRLQEEKRRGITIDLGFAHLELLGSDGERLSFGFVDVPGHERFVRNMLAGVGGIDLVLLVIAADEGIKPQTREHFDICRLLAVQRGITVLTKSDLVDAETLAMVREEVEDFLRGSFLETSQAPMISVSALKGTGLDELKRELVRVGREALAKDAEAITRLPIDRVFTMKGFGTVVTGTLVAGAVRKEDELELFPAGKQVRVRGVQVHGAAWEKAVAGERTALNLAAVEKHELDRGMVLASAGVLQTSSRLDVRLSLLPSARVLKQGSRVHLHAFASETIATVKLYEDKQLKPGAEAFAQLRLSAPLLLVPGDRFIIRQFSPVLTIGGGVVLDAAPVQKTPLTARLEFLSIQGGADPTAALLARIGRRAEQGLSLSQAVAETGWRKAVIESHLKEERAAFPLGGLLIQGEAFARVMRNILDMTAKFHEQNPLAAGITAATLRENVRANAELFDFSLDSLLRARQIEGVGGELVRLPGRGVVMKDEESESRKIIEQTFASAGLKVPALKDVLAGLKIDHARAHKIMTLLLREKVLINVSDDLVFHQSALAQLRQSLAAQKLLSPRLDVARFKDLTGVSRKYAIPLLEYLDRERVTKRVGDGRVIL
jgi:selenocysteine-specific elongation factor